jgi:hypothetical protein
MTLAMRAAMIRLTRCPFALLALFALFAVVPSLGCVHASSSAHGSGFAPKNEHLYRMDYVVSAKDSAGAATSSAYTMFVEERRTGDLRVGANVPLAAGPSAARTDIGLKIRNQTAQLADEAMAIQTDVEMSWAEEGNGIHKLAASSDALVLPGQPTLVASLDDPSTHKRYQVSVTATKLR